MQDLRKYLATTLLQHHGTGDDRNGKGRGTGCMEEKGRHRRGPAVRRGKGRGADGWDPKFRVMSPISNWLGGLRRAIIEWHAVSGDISLKNTFFFPKKKWDSGKAIYGRSKGTLTRKIASSQNCLILVCTMIKHFSCFRNWWPAAWTCSHLDTMRKPSRIAWSIFEGRGKAAYPRPRSTGSVRKVGNTFKTIIAISVNWASGRRVD